jgi:hypothetical protein
MGLPSKDVPFLPPVVTPQPGNTPADEHFAKQIGVLRLSNDPYDLRAVSHLLDPIGVPYAVTTSPALAMVHDLAILFPEAYPESFDVTQLNLLDDYVAGGGVIVAKPGEVPLLRQLGGIVGSTFQLEHHAVLLTQAGIARFPSLDRPEERTIPLGGDSQSYLNTWTLQLDPTATGVEVLATFEDGTPAIVERKVGAGSVVTIGLDYRDVVLRNQLGYGLNPSRGYINVFEPATDTWSLMVRDLYDATVRFGARLATAPDGARAALLLTHDIDWDGSYGNSLVYAEDEAAAGASATYLLHTKTVSDAQDQAFFSGELAPTMAALLDRGASIGSHSVAHSRVLATFPTGDGTESYPSYAPYNVSDTQTDDGSLVGELRVSKSLIDGMLEAQCVAHETRVFRAGNLSYHRQSPEMLERLGYRVDATRALGEVLSNFPYRAMTDWPDALDTSIFEFPVTIEDQLAPKLDQRIDQALAIVGANADNGAPSTFLLHPNILDFKRNAQQALLAGLPEGVVATSLSSFASFWAARATARIRSVEYLDAQGLLVIELTVDEAVKGLTLRVDPIVNTVLAPTGAQLIARGTDDFVVLPELAAGELVTIELSYPATP